MSERLNDYLAREAGDYVDGLSRLLDRPGAPDAAELLRLARGVRGSARLAGAETVARVAAGLEESARAMSSGTAVWSTELRARVAASVEELDRMLRGEIIPDVVPIAELFHDDAGPHVIAGPGADRQAGDIVPIEQLLLRGDRALSEALAMEPRLTEAIREHDPQRALALGEELFELIRLGATDAA